MDMSDCLVNKDLLSFTYVTVKLLLNARVFIINNVFFYRKGWAFIGGYTVGQHSSIHI